MTYIYTPHGVCSRQINFELDDDCKVRNVKFVGGCAGNTLGVAALIEGMDAEEAIKRLKGIDCRGRGTSCPDQLANAIEEAVEEF
ncbi:MAG: TIGR03905 family TSCPD domain-containing protein [Ruminococcus sp.]|nr:TIGR03905 family TSCPD domain-containing protein [Ruminococcus sp.]MDD6708761.1 TIGR03905 family TSCPD domain-containing protein [Ruminococcus sp.]